MYCHSPPYSQWADGFGEPVAASENDGITTGKTTDANICTAHIFKLCTARHSGRHDKFAA